MRCTTVSKHNNFADLPNTDNRRASHFSEMLIFSPLSIFFCMKAWTMLFKVHLYTCSKHGCHFIIIIMGVYSSPVFSSLLLDIPLRHFFTFSKRIILLYWRKKGNRTKKLILHCETLWTYDWQEKHEKRRNKKFVECNSNPLQRHKYWLSPRSLVLRSEGLRL